MVRASDRSRSSVLAFLFAAAAALVATGPSSAASGTYYVSPSGSDANPGTLDQPFATVQRGLQALQPGSTLYLRAGTYAAHIDSNAQTIPAGTSWSSPVTISGYPGEVATLRPGGGANVVNFGHGYVQYVTVSNLVIDATGVESGISLINGAHHNRFENCEVRNSTWDGIILAYGSGPTEYNEFLKLKVHDVGLSGHGHGIYIMTSNNLVAGCEFYNSNKWGVQIYNGYPSERANANVIRGNKIHHCGTLAAGTGGGITIGCGNDNLAYDNVLWSNLVGIDTIWGGPAYTRIYNNTIYGGGGQGITIGPDVTGARVMNNIAYRNNGEIIDYASSTQKSNNLTSNPAFVNAAGADFQLQPGSPAIDAGTTLSEVTNDITGKLRPVGGAYDIGAYEYGAGGAAPVAPPTNVKVTQQ
jgi:hypothetical protein